MTPWLATIAVYALAAVTHAMFAATYVFESHQKVKWLRIWTVAALWPLVAVYIALRVLIEGDPP